MVQQFHCQRDPALAPAAPLTINSSCPVAVKTLPWSGRAEMLLYFGVWWSSGEVGADPEEGRLCFVGQRPLFKVSA